MIRRGDRPLALRKWTRLENEVPQEGGTAGRAAEDEIWGKQRTDGI